MIIYAKLFGLAKSRNSVTVWESQSNRLISITVKDLF